MSSFIIDDVEERIRPHVAALREAGFKTTGSCGHDMWISIDAHASDFMHLYATLRTLGYKEFKISYEDEDSCWHHKGRFTITFSGELKGDGKPFDLVLLKVEPESLPLYFVLTNRKFSFETDDKYFFEEHTCPTNWTSDIIAVISHGDEDPHGFASFVQQRAPPKGMDSSGDINGDCNAVVWKDLFPEIETGKDTETK